MRFLAKTRSFLRNLFLARRVEAELDEEVRGHLEMLVEENVRSGMTMEKARRAARMELGGVDQVKEQVHEVRAGHVAETLFQDLRFGGRMLLKSRGFTLTVILTLALSVGANTAIFSLVNALLLKSLPYGQPERMGTIYTRISGAKASDERHKLNGEQWELLRDEVPALTTGLSIDDIRSWPDRIRAVTAEQVRDAAQKWLEKNRSVTGYLIKDAAPKREEKRS